MRRAAISIPCNIAEGEGRRTRKEFLRFLSIAHGSLRELETQTMIAGRLGYLSSESQSQILLSSAEVGRLITGLSNKLINRQKPLLFSTNRPLPFSYNLLPTARCPLPPAHWST
jgi:four helix bundle protein